MKYRAIAAHFGLQFRRNEAQASKASSTERPQEQPHEVAEAALGEVGRQRFSICAHGHKVQSRRRHICTYCQPNSSFELHQTGFR